MWEKETLLVTSNVSFSQSVFKRLVSQGRQKVSLCGNGLRHEYWSTGYNFWKDKVWVLFKLKAFTMNKVYLFIMVWLFPRMGGNHGGTERKYKLRPFLQSLSIVFSTSLSTYDQTTLFFMTLTKEEGIRKYWWKKKYVWFPTFSPFHRLPFTVPETNFIIWLYGMVLNAIFNSFSVILWWPVHLSKLSWSPFNKYSTQYSFQATGCFPT